MYKLQLILVIGVLCCIAATTARPTEEHGRKILPHARTSTRKRHADISITHQISKNYQELKRMLLLNNLVGSLESGKNYSVEVYPDKDAIPDQKDISEDLLSRLNGEKVDDKLRVRVVGQRPVTVPRHLNEFIEIADNLRQQAAATKTCLDLQKAILNVPSIRIRVRCRSQAHKRSVPVIRSSSFRAHPQIYNPYRYRPYRRPHINGHHRYKQAALNRRHTYMRASG